MTLAVQDLTRRFGRTTVLDGASLEAADGERVALLGPNGSGKTTLLRVAAGILRPTTGHVLHDGTPTTKPEGRRGLALVPQDAAVYPEITVREHVSWWARVHGAPATPGDADGLLDDAGLRRLATESAGSLSRGQRQRLAVCMALAVEPRTLLLDEPTTALDDAGRHWLTTRLREHPATLLVATHEPDFADALGARRLHLDGGRLR